MITDILSDAQAPLAYPIALEDWWMSFACAQMGGKEPQVCLEALAPQVQQLSDRFIEQEGQRKLQGYGQQEAMLLAYGLFFFPQTFTRVQFPLAEACRVRGWRPPEGRPLRLLDLGAGLGAASLGLVDWFQRYSPALEIELHMLEQQQLSLDWSRLLLEQLSSHWPGCSWQLHRGDLRRPESCRSLKAALQQPWDLILASFSLNEAFEGMPIQAVNAWIQASLERLSPGGLLLLLEPASQTACERLEILRDTYANTDGSFIWGPCLHAQSCPLLAAGESWCHEVRRWHIPASLKYINRRMYRAIEVLKFGFLTLGRAAPPAPLDDEALLLRLISPMSRKKGRWLASGCGDDGARWPLEIPSRQLDAQDKAMLKQLSRGDILRLELPGSLLPHPKTGALRLPKGMLIQTK